MNASPKIVIYGSECCTYCTAARMLLTKKGVRFSDVLVTSCKDAHREMEELCGHSSLPQILIDDRPIGGFDELYMLEKSGELDGLLGRTASTADN